MTAGIGASFVTAMLANPSVAWGSTVIEPGDPIALSDGGNGDKPKMQRAGDGTLIVAYGDSPAGAPLVYDVKADFERPARDIFVKTCKPSATKSCDLPGDWSAPVNVSNSAMQVTDGVFDWRGINGNPEHYPGDIDKPNIKTSGPMVVLTWVSKYCPDGDPSPGVQPAIQRGVRYLERDGGRVIPFSCTWTSYSTTKGASWSAPVQLSSGIRDAIQDSSSGSINTDTTSPSYNKGQIVISWQEDPQGLQLGEADGPGDGASGANVSNGTDVWYTYATVDLSVANTPADDFVPVVPMRITDNVSKLGIGGTTVAAPVFDGAGNQLLPRQVEAGRAGAARPNIGIISGQTIIAYEETKASAGLDEGKFVRYHTFPYAAPPQQSITIAGQSVSIGTSGCIISDPLKNARRVRFLTQSPADAGQDGIQLAIFWKEGIYDNGGPSDIVFRRAGGSPTAVNIAPSYLFPAVDAACETSLYADAIVLLSDRAQNLSSRTPVATDANLLDDTEADWDENALAHRGVLRGQDLWLGYTYTADLVAMWAQLDNYNFWVRKYTVGVGWDTPQNVTNITDTRINVREPRIFGTPKSNASTCPTGDPNDPSTTAPTDCQDQDVVYLAWGTQENVSPFDLDGGDDLGIYITRSSDGGLTYLDPVRYSAAMGSLFGDEESAYEAQIVTRPDGTRFYGVWNQHDSVLGETAAEYCSGDVLELPDCDVSDPDSDGDGVCDSVDSCPAQDATGWDLDRDGCIDDTDGDGVGDDLDDCLFEDASGWDLDGDGCIDDTDGDGFLDPDDTCPTYPDPRQLDTDGDGIGNVCTLVLGVTGTPVPSAALTLGSSGANPGETVYFRVTDVASGQVATRVAVANASGVATTTYVVPAAAVPGDELIVISAALRGPSGSESVASVPETLVVE